MLRRCHTRRFSPQLKSRLTALVFGVWFARLSRCGSSSRVEVERFAKMLQVSHARYAVGAEFF